MVKVPIISFLFVSHLFFNVIYLKLKVQSELSIEPSLVRASIGTEVNFTCKDTGNSSGEIYWEKDGERLNHSSYVCLFKISSKHKHLPDNRSVLKVWQDERHICLS